MSLDTTNGWLFINPETYPDTEAAKALDIILSKQAINLDLDSSLATLAYGEREKSVRLFKNTIDQPIYNSSPDHRKIRQFILDWYSAHKTMITKSRHAMNLYLLSHNELNELLLSFGFPYPRHILSKKHKIALIKSLINPIYKRKGTPDVLAKTLIFYGLSDVIISEWWIHNNPTLSKPYYAKSKVIYPTELKNLEDLSLIKPYEEFIENNPHWHLTESQLDAYVRDPENRITLPSIAPVISIQAYTNLSDIDLAMAVLQRKVQETYDFWLQSLAPINMVKMTDNTSYQNLPIDGPYIITNTPPVITEDTDDIYKKVIIGPIPLGGFEDHSKKIAEYVLNEETEEYEWTFSNPINGKVMLVDSSSSIYPNTFIKWDSLQNRWKTYNVNDNTVFPYINRITDTTSSLIWNGEEYVDLIEEIPTCSMLASNNILHRDISLNNFTSLYSFFEVVLAIAYLFKLEVAEQHPDDTTFTPNENRKHLFFDYNQLTSFTPIDKPYGVTNRTGCGEIYLSDNIDNIMENEAKYEPLVDYYEDLTINQKNGVLSFRHNSEPDPFATDLYEQTILKSPYIRRKEKLETYFNVMQKDNDFSIISGQFPQMYPEQFLKAINLDFFNELVEMKNLYPESIIERLITDFENYLSDKMGLINFPFSYVMRGGDFYNSRLKPIVNFLKPFRVKVLDFSTSFSIKNPLLDSMLCDDRIETLGVEQLIVDKPFPRIINDDIVDDIMLDNGLGSDECTLQVYCYFHEASYSSVGSPGTYRAPLGESDTVDNNYSQILDLNMTDSCFIEITDGGDDYGTVSIDDDEIITTGTID